LTDNATLEAQLVTMAQREMYLLEELKHARAEVSRLGILASELSTSMAREACLSRQRMEALGQAQPPRRETIPTQGSRSDPSDQVHVRALDLIVLEDVHQMQKGRDQAYDDALTPDAWEKALQKIIRKRGGNPSWSGQTTFWVGVGRLAIAAIESLGRKVGR
jgi:hypothetical protein